MLLKLLEVLSGEQLPKPTKGRMRIHCLENVEKALQFLREQKVHLENVGSHDIVDGNHRLTLGLLWTIILRFQIQDISVETEDNREKKSAKDALLLWCQMKTAGYPNVQVQNFSSSWRDGLAFNALIHRHRPDLVPMESLQRCNAHHNLQRAFDVAERELGLAKLLDPEDVNVEQPDERSLITYVATLYHYFSKMKALAVEGKRVGKALDAARQAQAQVSQYEVLAGQLLAWIHQTTLSLRDRHLPNALPGLQGQLQAFSTYRTVHKPPKFLEKGNLEVLLFTVQSRMRANNLKVYVPREGKLISDINKAWEQLEKAEHEREVALRTELIRQEKLQQLASRFDRKAALRETWLSDNQRLLAQDNFGSELSAVEAAVRKHEAIETDIEAYSERVQAVGAVATELEAEGYHDMGRVAARRHQVEHLWNCLRQLVASRRERLQLHLELQKMLQDLEHLMGWMEEMKGRLQSQDLGKHLRGVDDLLQLHGLVEADVAAQAERVRALSAAALRFTGAGYQPCEPALVHARVASLEQHYQELVELAALRRRSLEQSRCLWKFFWDLGEEEAWMREQERLLSCQDLGKDLTSSLRLLSQHDAFLGQLSGREGPLQQALAQGRALVAKGQLGAASQVSQRIQEVEGRWRALSRLAAEREGRLKEAAGGFQFQAEVADLEAWLEDASLLVASPELGHDEFSTRSLVRKHQEVQEELRHHRGAVEGLMEQAARLGPGCSGGAGRLGALQRRYREVEEEAERRRKELQAAVTFYTTRSEAEACGLWLAEKEQWLQAMEVPGRLEEMEVVQQRFETLEQEMLALGARVAAVNQASQQLLATSWHHQESIQATWGHLSARWQSFASLAEQRRTKLSQALALQNFHLECTEAAAWMKEKTKLIEATPGSGADSVTALRRKLRGLERELEAIQGKVLELRAEGARLGAGEPQQEAEISSALASLGGLLEELRRRWRRRQEELGEAAELQGVLRELSSLQGWVRRTEVVVASEDLPASPGEAEALLRQHQGVRKEMEQYGADYARAKARGWEVVGRQQRKKKEEEEEEEEEGGQRSLLQQRLEALEKGWQELERMWEKRQQLLAQALAFQVFLRDAKKVEGVLGKQEYALCHTEVPGTLPGAEAALKKQEDFMGTMEATGERLQGLLGSAQKLLAEGGLHAEEVKEMMEKVESRHQRNREVAQELLEKLKANLELQRFLQDGQELSLWLEEKMLRAQDVACGGGRELQAKWQKHQTFAAELAAGSGWLQKLQEEGLQLSCAKPELEAVVQERLCQLQELWHQLEATSSAKAKKLFEAHRAELCAQACATLAAWLDPVSAQLRSDDFGKDLTSVGILLKKQQLLEKQLAEQEQELAAVRAQAQELSPEAAGGDALRGRLGALEEHFRALREPLRQRQRRLLESRGGHQLHRDLQDEILWVRERQPLATSTDLGKDLPSVQLLLKKNQSLQKELQGHEPRVAELLRRGQGRGAAWAAAGSVQELRAAWQQLRAQAELRQRHLRLALAAQQFYSDAAQAEAWMGEQELHMMAQERAKDELGAQAQLKRQAVLEQELAAYAHSLQQLAAQGRAMVDSDHPESERLQLRQAQVDKLYASLRELAQERCQALREQQRLCQLRRDLDDLEQWISEREVVAASQELGQDFEHVTLLRDKFREFSRDTSALGQERVDAANAAADALIAGGHPDNASVAEWKDALNEAWADLLELMDTRAQMLAASYELQRFHHEAGQTLAQVREKQKLMPEELGKDLGTAEAMERLHSAHERDIEALSAQVRQVQEEASRLAQAYAGPRAAQLRQEEAAVSQAWAQLRARSQSRQRLLRATAQHFRFLRRARDLLLWMEGVQLQLRAQQRPRDVSSADLLIQGHQSLKAEVEARTDSLQACLAAGTALLQRGHYAAEQVSAKLEELQERRREIEEHWKEKMDWLQTALEVQVFGRDASLAEAWLSSQEPLLRSAELGGSVAEVEALLKRHRELQKAAAAWEERIGALRRLTRLEQQERLRRQQQQQEEEEEEEERRRKKLKGPPPTAPPGPPPQQDEPGEGPKVVPPELQNGGGEGERPPEPPTLNGICPEAATPQAPALTNGGRGEAEPRQGLVQAQPDPAHAATLPSPRGPQPAPDWLEGGLCRKHEMEAQGKKAPNRSWQSVFCVLRGGSLSFFKDAKSAGAGGGRFHGEPPLALGGARALPATSYKKRKHCFRLGLIDGKEFLFQAKDEAEMTTWLRVIQSAASLPSALPREGPGVALGGAGKGVARAMSMPPTPPPPAQGHAPAPPSKRFSFFKKNK